MPRSDIESSDHTSDHVHIEYPMISSDHDTLNEMTETYYKHLSYGSKTVEMDNFMVYLKSEIEPPDVSQVEFDADLKNQLFEKTKLNKEDNFMFNTESGTHNEMTEAPDFYRDDFDTEIKNQLIEKSNIIEKDNFMYNTESGTHNEMTEAPDFISWWLYWD